MHHHHEGIDYPHHHHGCDNEHHHHHHHHCDKHAPDCDDQLPAFAHVGRGIKGDGFYVEISDPDSCTETYLEGFSYDEATKTFHNEWRSKNINGGELSYQYNLRPFTDPRTFTITWIYRRPGRCEWSWTTPAIPYIWTIGDGGVDSNPDHIVGSGVATVFVRASKSEPWNVKKHERLHYPIDPNTGKPYSRDTFNAPEPEKAWSATITFGYGGDVELPNFDDIAKIIGCSKDDIFNILQDNSVHWDGIEADNLLDYINKCDKRDRDHFHKDLGFNSDGHADTGAFGGEDTVKKYIDRKLAAADEHIQNLYYLINQIAGNIYGATLTEDANLTDSNKKKVPDGKGYTLTLPSGTKIPVGDLNVFTGGANVTANRYTNALRSRSISDNDIEFK